MFRPGVHDCYSPRLVHRLALHGTQSSSSCLRQLIASNSKASSEQAPS